MLLSYLRQRRLNPGRLVSNKRVAGGGSLLVSSKQIF